ncbi:MAG: hypothetical protein HY862_16860 [Chloroflexi bacterium]|nr:hypothetical protein [Chloroflexota bacterium]
MDSGTDLENAQRLTMRKLISVLNTTEEFTHLNLRDVTELAEEVSRILPAGNVVTMVWSQLASIKGRRVNENETRKMLALLNQGMATFLDRAAYLTFYTTPAILISGYSKMLQAVGRDPSEAFPNGTWQFYLEFGLREDTGRHACETVGFQQTARQEKFSPSEADDLAAWILAASELILLYDDLLFEEWHERNHLHRLDEKIGDGSNLISEWVKRRPYGVPSSISQDYVTYRQAQFRAFVKESLERKLKEGQIDKIIQAWEKDETLLMGRRKAYQDQMSLLAILEPGEFNDTRTPITLESAQVAVQYRGEYYLIPVQHRGHRLDEATIRAFAQSIVNAKSGREKATLDQYLVVIPRQHQRGVRSRLPNEIADQFERLRYAPVLINWDEADSSVPLSEIRRGRRGIGDHALTIFRADKSTVFDQSHIFFDAIWGMAVAEILTNQAIALRRKMNHLPPIERPSLHPIQLEIAAPSAIMAPLRKEAVEPFEMTAEVTLPLVRELNELRRLLMKRNQELNLTVNDFLILYRALYNQYYDPSQKLRQALETLTIGSTNQRKAAQTMSDALRELNLETPAFLIPIDASVHNPQDRIFPVTFRPLPPWTDIGPQHEKTYAWMLQLNDLNNFNKKGATKEFNEARTYYLEMLKMFAILMTRYKEVALMGESFSTVTLKILASVPKKLQPMLRSIPDRIDILNDMLKGTEVFSNVGRVASTSSLTRFMTAKDDNEKKVLCWGIMTRADGTMVISLRDFRPQVEALHRAGAGDVARLVTQDFLNGYADGLRRYVFELTEIVRVRR